MRSPVSNTYVVKSVLLLCLGVLLLSSWSKEAEAKFYWLDYDASVPGYVQIEEASMFAACEAQRDDAYPLATELYSVVEAKNTSTGNVKALICRWVITGSTFPQYITWGSIDCDTGEIEDASAPDGCRKTEEVPLMCTPSIGDGPGTSPDLSGGWAINPVSGSTGLNASDFSSGTGSKSPLGVTRTYSSDQSAGSRLGAGWSTQYDRQFYKNSPTSPSYISISRPDGRLAIFRYKLGVGHPAYWTGYSYTYPQKDLAWTLVASGTDWVFTDEDGTVETYNADGELIEIDKPGGETLTLAYDVDGNNTTVTDASSRVITFTYDSKGLATKVTDPDGEDYLFEYEKIGDTGSETDYDLFPRSIWALKKVIYPDDTPLTTTDNPSVQYHYDDADHEYGLAGVTDENGVRSLNWEYNADQRATKGESTVGNNVTTVAYDDVAGTRTFTNPLGKQTKYHVEKVYNHYRLTKVEGVASTNCVAADTTFAYNTNGFLSQKTDREGNVTTYARGTDGLETSRTEDFGGAQARTITTSWDATKRKPTQIVNAGVTVDMTYDTDGNMTLYKLTDTTSHSVPYSTNGQTRSWAYAYTAAGLLSSVDGPLSGTGDTVSYTYDTDGYLATVTNEVSHVTTVNSVNGNGLPLQVTDANAVRTDFAYNERGWVTTITADATGTPATTTLAYDDLGQITKITKADGSYLEYTYSNDREVTSVENSLGERIEYTHDAMGNVTAVSVKNASSTIVKSQTQTFDELGRLMASIGAGSQSTDYDYNKMDQVTDVTDPRSKVYSKSYDGLNRLIKDTDPDLADIDYGLDDDDNLTSVTDDRSNATTYVQNGFGDVIQRVSPDTGTTTYTVNALGLVTQETDARSVITNRTFDDRGRMLTETFPASTSENVTYTYDATASGNKGKGRLTSISDGSGSMAFVYNVRGFLTSEIRVIATKSYTTTYTYDSVGRVASMTYDSGRIVTYTRDGEGRITSLKTKKDSGSSEVTVASSATYLPFGPMKGLTHGNGQVMTAVFDSDYRLTDLDTTDGTTDAQDLAYTYDAASNITGITDAITSARTQTFAYDDLNRLTDADGLYGDIDYVYDTVGNRTSRVVDTGSTVTETYTYPSTSNRLTSVADGTDTRTFTYDAAGNVIDDDRTSSLAFTLGYNDAGRLDEIKENGTYLSGYTYNAFQQRVEKDAVAAPSPLGTATIHYIYDTFGRMIAEATSAGTVTTEYIYLDAMPLGLVTDVDTTPVLSHVHTDHLGSPQKITNASGAIVWDAALTPFGVVASLTGSLTQNRRFPGQYFDIEAGFHQNWHRDYDPLTGRYVQSDPIGLAGGINTFAYVGGNPLSFVDPTGEAAVELVGGWIAADVAIPEPSDALWPKWVGYGVGFAGAVAFDYLLYNAIFGDEDADGKEADRSIPYPAKRRGQWTCTCRADANQNIIGNCASFAFGTYSDPSRSVAAREAKRIAAHNLGQQPKHTQCKCTGPKGERWP